MIGKTLAHYEILEKLGAGGMGEVYRARDTKLGREIAIKVLPAEFSKDAERRNRFTREAQAIAALKHPGIVTIYSVEEAGGHHFITMELVEGTTLSTMIPKGGLKLDQFFEYAVGLADAVSAAHEEGITHRDLKPANVMFDKGGRLKVLDFGLAKLLDPNDDLETARTIAQGSDTAVGQILGTAAYMSPEQAEGLSIDHRSDIFSMGIVLYEMATGERPFKGKTHVSTVSSIIKDTPPHISELNHSLPRHLGRIVNHCLEKDPDKRFQSAKDVRNDLQGLKKEIDSGELAETTTSGITFGAPTAQKRWLPWVVTGVVVVLAASLVLALLPRSRGGSDRPQTAASISDATSQTTGDTDDRKMAVVLPFENLGDAEDDYFAAGMSEEITSRLAAVSGMGVISRTSATQYDRTGKTMREIGRDLGVDYVLEGTVRWAKNSDGTERVRITPQLIRVADDTHMWSDSYDRDIDDVFQVQSEIATEVINALDVTLSGLEKELVEDTPTQNTQAYKLYLQAKNLPIHNWNEFDRGYVELMEKAASLDPQFVEPVAALVTHHSNFYSSPLDASDERLSRARDALERAEAIDKEHQTTHVARGAYHYYGFRDYDKALEEFLAATRLVPNDAKAREFVGYIYRRQGKWNEAIENLGFAFELAPQDGNIAGNIAATYRAMRRFEEATRYIKKASEIAPDESQHPFGLATYALAASGDIKKAKSIVGAIEQGNPFWRHLGMYVVHEYERDFGAAAREAEKIQMGPVVRGTRLSLIAEARFRERGLEGARQSLEKAREALKEVLDTQPGNHLFRGMYASALAHLGEHEEAAREAKLTVDLVAKDRFEGPRALEGLAVIYAEIGRHEEAIDILERLMSTVYERALTPKQLELEHFWDPLRDNPRFQALLKKNV